MIEKGEAWLPLFQWLDAFNSIVSGYFKLKQPIFLLRTAANIMNHKGYVILSYFSISLQPVFPP